MTVIATSSNINIDASEKPKGTTKSNGKKEKNDKFYTHPDIAKKCLSLLELDEYTIKIEPSAGSGSFSNLVKSCVPYDIEPEGEGIIKQDWLEYSQERNSKEKVLVFGNPPFGVQNNLAIKFINHSAKFADTIAFILPRSFRKDSVVDRINPHLFLRRELILPKNSFLLEGKPYNLPAVFQIWDYNPTATRAITVKELPIGFSYVKKTENPDFSIQRVGGNAGKASLEWESKNSQSHNFVTLDDKSRTDELVDLINNHVFTSRDDAVGPRSIPKTQMTKAINGILKTI